jgi:hypothetical protein
MEGELKEEDVMEMNFRLLLCEKERREEKKGEIASFDRPLRPLQFHPERAWSSSPMAF